MHVWEMAMDQKNRFQNVAVLMGGISAERDISLRSGAAAVAGLQACGYTVTSLDLQEAVLELPDNVEAVFLALHGTFGEDGTVQAELARRGIPFTGSGERASRLAMDKAAAKCCWERAGIPTAPFGVLSHPEVSPLHFPVVVKPVAQGSSIGVHLVQRPEDWDAALKDAFAYDVRVMVEAYIAGREVTVGILDGTALPVVEIVAPDGWYGFGAKYMTGDTRYDVPADLPADMAAHLQTIALQAFDALGCKGFGRVDFRLPDDGEAMVLEVNTIPGLTETSLLPKSAAAAGISFDQLCRRIMETAAVDCREEATHG